MIHHYYDDKYIKGLLGITNYMLWRVSMVQLSHSLISLMQQQRINQEKGRGECLTPNLLAIDNLDYNQRRYLFVNNGLPKLQEKSN